MKSLAATAAVLAGLALAGCASAPASAPVGSTFDQVVARQGRPTAEYPRPDGGRRLEYWGGTWNRSTWMLDLDARGTLAASTQVLNERTFNALRVGASRAEVLYQIGHPSDERQLTRQNQDLWNYRYENMFCLWFQVSIDRATDRVAETGYGPDPACTPRD